MQSPAALHARARPRAVLLLALLVLAPLGMPLAGAAACATAGCTDWSSSSETGGTADVAMAPDGATLYVAASRQGANGRSDFATLAYAADTGALRWSATWDGPASSVDNPRAVAVTADGATVVVAGTSQNRLVTYPDNEYLAQDVAVVAYGAKTGALLWSARHNGAANLEEMVYGLALSPDGTRAFVVGRTQSGSDNLRAHDALVVAFNASSGAKLWSATLGGTANDLDAFTAVATGADGASVYAAGFSRNSGTYQDMQVAAYDAQTGARSWSSAYTGLAASSQEAGADVVVARQRVIVSGSSANNAFATVAYHAANGTQAWASRASTTLGTGGALALAAAPDGARVFATGTANAASGYTQILTLAYGVSDGVEAWRRQDASAHSSYPSDIVADASGTRVYVAGSMMDASFMSFARTIAYDATTGAAAWTRDVADWSHARAAVAPDSSRVVAGGGYGRVSLIAYGTGISTERHELRLTPAQQRATIGLLGAAAFPLSLSNAGNVDETVALGVHGLPEGWTATLSRAGETTPVTTLELAAGERVELTLRVCAPLTLLQGEATASVTAAAAAARATANATVAKTPTHVELPPSIPPVPALLAGGACPGVVPGWVPDAVGLP